MAKKQDEEKEASKRKKTTATRKSKAATSKEAKPPIPPRPLPHKPSMSEPDLEARLNLFKVELGKDKKLNAAFNAIYAENSGNWVAISEELNPEKGFETNIVKKLEFTHHLAEWSKDNVKLVRVFQKDKRTNSMRDIAANFNRANFTQLLSKEKACGEGKNAKMLADNLYNDLFHLQPTAMLKRMVEETPIVDRNMKGNIAKFLANQPDTFNIKTTSVYEAFKNENAFEGIAPELHEKIKTEVKSLQRVAALSPVPEVLPVLMKANVTSAMMVSDMPEDQFVKAFSSQLGANGETVARQVHVNAVNARIRNEQALISLKEVRQGTGIAMVDKGMRNAIGESSVFDGILEKNNLSWDILFGDTDFCECGECTSVYSAASYFVELLQYLRNNNLDPTNLKYLFCWQKIPGNDNVRLIEFLIQKFSIEWVIGAIITKIDDNKTIKVTNGTNSLSITLNDDKNNANLTIDDGRIDQFIVKTENSELNIYNPSIKSDPKDISNTPLQKLFDRRPDLKCLQLTCTNTNTKLPYVDLVNEVMESYVVQKTLPFNVGEDETSGELLAQPHHTEYEAYKLLHDAVYPFALPHHQPIDAARIYLNYLGTSRYELINTFRSTHYSWHLLFSSSIIQVPKKIMDVDESYDTYLDIAADAEYLGLTQDEYVILTKEAFLSKENWDKQIAKNGKRQVHKPQEYADKIGVKPVHKYYGYPSEPEMLSVDEGLTFVKGQFLKRTGLKYLDLVELLKTQCLNPNVPKGQALSIMDRIQASYRFLQWLVNQEQAPEKKYELVIMFIRDITTPQEVAYFNQLFGIDDPCNLEKVGVPLKEGDVEQWVYDYFERVGQIIVLDNGAKCIDGKLSRNSDNRFVDIGIKIEKCQIINEATGVVVGSIDKITGLITLKQGQPGGDWSKIIFTGNKGEKGTFVNVLGKYYLITAKGETCDLNTVRLIHLDGSPITVKEYDHIHRFIRLWRKLGWTINETDNSVVSLGKTKKCDISPQLLHQLVAVKKLYEKSGLELIKLLTFWTNISTVGEKSLYKRLFLTHNLLGVDRVFHADENGRYLVDTTQKILDHVPVLMAALNLKADDIEAIMDRKGIKKLTIENVSTLYRYRLLSKMLDLRIPDFISVLPLFEDPFANADATLLFLEKWGRIEDAGFTYRHLNYIIKDQDDPKKPLALTQKTALQLAKILYDGLNAIEEAHRDLKADPKTTIPEQERERQTLATTELVKEKAALLYDQVTVEKIIGILEGTTIYSAVSPAGVKDLLRPIPLKPPISTQDYEYLQLDNYPLLKKKVKYDSAKGSIQIKGLLTKLEREGSSLFLMDDFIDLSSMVSKLIDPGSDPVSLYLWSKFSGPSQDTLKDVPPNALKQREAIVKEFNKLITGGASIASHFIGIKLSVVTNTLIVKNPTSGNELIRLNRLLLEDAYPREIAKNQRVGLNTILANLEPDLPLSEADDDESIENQQKKLFNDLFKGTFNSFETDFRAINDQPIDPVTGSIDDNTRAKRLKFLEIFLPYLRKELTHRFIVNTLSSQTGLGNDVTDLLITKILETAPSVPIYTLFEGIKEAVNSGSTSWDGYLIPSAEGQYTFIVQGLTAQSALNIDGIPITFVQQTNPSGEWWSADQKLQAGKVYKLKLTGMQLENVSWKTATSSITSILSTSLLPTHAEDNTVKAFTHLQKAALLINGFILSADEIQYLSDNSSDFGSLNFNEIKLEQFLRLESYTRLRNSLPAAKINILEFFKWTHRPGGSKKLIEKIEELTGWKKERIEQLIHKNHFNLLQPKSFRNEISLLKLQKALEVANKNGMSIDLLFDWANPESDFAKCHDIADSIQHAIRALYKQEDWEQVVKPLSDKLRENQKNALIAYLLVHPDVIEWGVTDANGLFEFFLIDVQMGACMETSRIKQAISSVQLFIQRCFLGLEISPNVLDLKRSEWIERGSGWEANRKIFLYPENWIESNLRDDKSPFFKELESELLQKDINKQNVEDALKAYLYKVDEVANMEVIGLYIEEGKKLHVFSRTRNAPYFFYYRYLDIPAGNWYPWEKMQVDIPSYDVEFLTEVSKNVNTIPPTYTLNENYKNIIGNGCYLIPVVWNDRLLIFFPQFMRKTLANDVSSFKSIREISEESTSSLKVIEYWEIKMAWSEYRNGKWTQKQVSKDAMYDIPNIQDIQDTATFWKVFVYASNTKANEAAAKKKYEDAAKAFDKEKKILEDFYTKPGIPATISTDNVIITVTNIKGYTYLPENPNHPLIIANKKKEEAYIIYIDAKSDSIEAANALSASLPPPSVSDVSKYEFVPVIYAAGNFAGIEVFYKGEGKNFFDFNGSNITVTNAYPGSNSFQLDRFHHKSSVIQSLQISNEANNHLFDDEEKTTYTYFFNNTIKFHHSDSHKLLGVINSQQLESFFKFHIVNIPPDKDDVFGGYDHDNNTQTPNSYHELKRPYSIYNWELFFHTPMMLGDSLSKSQQFKEAMKWYHYVFNPMADGGPDNPLWQFSPFKDMDAKHILDHIFNKLKPNQSDPEINEWRSNPFKPHLVARGRPVAYMKWVVMKYIDNLVAWGDYLFRQDTIESINQATQLYILAGHILGARPQMIPKRGKIKPQTYLSLLDKWDAFSNAMVELEMSHPFSNQTPLLIGIGNGVVGLANVFGFASTTYFCIPNNPKLMGYWDTISDRLFKIRHCENIEGIFRKLPLFEPPIDPALLVKAAAQGLSIASVLNDLNTPMPNYRFYYLLQKALELCGELKSMGSAMLSAIEKKDNETISLIRSKHENSMLNLVMEVKKQQLDEAQKTMDSLQQNRKSPEHRMKYYLQLIGEDTGKVPGLDSEFSEIANAIETPIDESGLKLIKYEKQDMDKASEAADWQKDIGIVETIASVLHALPLIAADVKPMGIGPGIGWGGSNLGNMAQAVAKGMQTHSSQLSFQSSSAGKKGGFLRSLQDRVMQANAAGYEIKQIDKQILTQKIRIAIANLEITNHQKQIANAQEIEEFLKNKYSSEELYSWMKDSLSTLYHQVYSLAFDLSKKAEKVYRFERGLTNSNFIQAGYWDAGYDGLLAGEQLYVGLKQLEAAYHENRGYDYEITKHVSLRQISPMAILQLKHMGKCEFALPEVLFDIDYPGHYKRRIKSVSISIPCVAGPYVGLNGTLRLLENKFRNSAISNNYSEKTDEADDRFQSFIIPINAIAASSGQNESGMFELNFKDERYLPFEGAGAISKWRFELPTALRQFDYNTISDVIIHVRYTSVEGGASLKTEAEGSVKIYVKNAEQISKEEGLFAIFDLKHDFPSQWHQLFSQNQQTTDFIINNSHFPYLFNTRTLEISETKVYLKAKKGMVITPSSTDITLNRIPIASWNSIQDISLIEGTVDLTGSSPIKTWAVNIGTNLIEKIDDFLILIKYRVKS